ncbi:cyclic AMP-dependent transcription factor ATF-5-like [Ptychodera flava]|uniref:cyclic AMP-dependent transcription factor ATF-5-like n=1 Tax=Ptychodera flava TaxID=63121 RepID=UPI003969C20B
MASLYEDSLFSSLLGELEKDSLFSDIGVKGTPDDKYAVEADNLFQGLDPLEDPLADTDWMTEKIDFNSFLDHPQEFLKPESTISSELEELLTVKEDVNSFEVDPADLELLQSLAVDPEIPVSLSLGENNAADLIALSPSSLGSETELMALSPSSMGSETESRSASPSTLLDNLAQPDLQATALMAQLIQQQSKDTADQPSVLLHQPLTPPKTPDTITVAVPENSPKDDKKREAPKRARSKVKTASGSKIIDKKSRKRDQNKLAATRYREKKRAELMCVQEEEDGLVQKNKELNEQVDSLQREIKYMKELMLDIYKAKGIPVDSV